MANTSNSDDAVHITLSDYISLLSRVNEATQILWDIKEVELEGWRNNTTARLSELTTYVERRLIRNYQYEYNDYNKSLKAKPLKWWEKWLGRKALDRKSEFETELDFAKHRLEADGWSYDTFYADALGPAVNLKPWEAVNHVYQYDWGERKTNNLDEAKASIEKEHDLISRSPVATFTLPRWRYNHYLSRIAEAEKTQAEKE